MEKLNTRMNSIFFSPLMFTFLKISNILACSWLDLIFLCITEYVLRKLLVE